MLHLIGLGFPLGAPPGRDPSPEEGMRVILSCAAEQLRDLVLHVLQFVETQTRIGHDERVAGGAMFVNQEAALLGIFSFDLFENAFPFEHRGQHVTGVGRRLFRRNQSTKQLLGVFFCQRLGRGVGQRFVACFPKRKRLDVFVPVLPCFLAQIFAAETIRLAKEERVKIFPGFEWTLGRGAGVSARRYCKCVRNGASSVTGKSELKWRYWRSSGKLRYSARTLALPRRNGVSLQLSILREGYIFSSVIFPASS